MAKNDKNKSTATETKTESENSAAEGFNLDAATFDDPQGGESLSGVGDMHPAWVPHFVELSDDLKKKRMEKLAPGSTFRKDLRGKLAIERAWGRALYFIDVDAGGGKSVRVRAPEHTSLYAGLNQCALGGDVRLVYAGRGERAKKGQQAPHLYDVIPGTGVGLNKPRPDALEIKRTDDDESK